MVKKKVVTGLLCLGLALALSLGHYIYLLKEPGDKESLVLIASREITAGELLRAEDFTLKSIPGAALTKEMTDNLGLGPLYAAVTIPAGSYYLNNLALGEPPLLIGENQVKVTIKVDLYSALGGQIKSGDRINLGYIPPLMPGDKEELYKGIIIAEDLLIAYVTNEKGQEIKAVGENNLYGPREPMLPAALTLICKDQEQSLVIKEYERAGYLFLTMGKELVL